MIWPEPAKTFDEFDPLSGFAGLDGLRRAKIIEAAPRMGFNIAERFVLGGQIGQYPGKKRVLVHVCEIPGMVGVLVGQHLSGTFA